MILIPEIETVVILVPRTGSGSLRRAVQGRWPKSILIYRHMEADGVPQGYDRWHKVGVVREPVERLWSLYKFLLRFDGNHDPDYINAMRQSVAMPFDEWIVCNQVPFTSPYDSANRGRYWPQFTVRHPLPENRKSQFVYLRPDLGTEVHRFNHLRDLERRLDVRLNDVDPQNVTDASAPPELSETTQRYVETAFAWDLANA